MREELNGLYVEVDDESAREKISIAFRDIVRRIKRQKAKQDARGEHDQQDVEPLAFNSHPAMGADHNMKQPHHLYGQPLPVHFAAQQPLQGYGVGHQSIGAGTLDLTDGSHQHKRRKCGDGNSFNYFCGGR